MLQLEPNSSHVISYSVLPRLLASAKERAWEGRCDHERKEQQHRGVSRQHRHSQVRGSPKRSEDQDGNREVNSDSEKLVDYRPPSGDEDRHHTEQ